jgi:hypothetical protein
MISRLCAAMFLFFLAGCAPAGPGPISIDIPIDALRDGVDPVVIARLLIARGQRTDRLIPTTQQLRACVLETSAEKRNYRKAPIKSNARFLTRHELSLFDLSAPRVEPLSGRKVKLIYRRKNPYERAAQEAETFLTLYADTTRRFLAAHEAPGDVSPGIANQRAMMLASLQARLDWWVRYRPYVPISRGYPHVPVAADVDLPAPKPGAGLFDDLADTLAAAPVTMETLLIYEGKAALADKLVTASYQIPGELRFTAKSIGNARRLAAVLHAHAAADCPAALE